MTTQTRTQWARWAFSTGEFSQNIPNLFGRVAELTTRHTGTETVVADTDALILEGIGKVIVALGHGTDEDGDALIGLQRLQVVPGAHQGGFETHGDLATVGRQVVGDGVLDDLEQFLLRIGRADG